MQNFIQSIVLTHCYSCTHLFATLRKNEDVRYGECLLWTPENGGTNAIYNVFTSVCDNYEQKVIE